MKKKIIIISGSLLLSVSLATGVFAATKYSIFVNGTKINADVKVINGTTYVPLRAVSEALGANVSLTQGAINIALPNAASTTAVVPTQPTTIFPITTPSPTPSHGPSVGSRTNPAAIAEVMNFKKATLSEEFTGKLTVLQTIRGQQAWDMIHTANKFNFAAKEGYEFILASIKIDVEGGTNPDKAISVHPIDFTLVSSNGVDYDHGAVVTPSPELDTQIYVGGSQTGWVAFQVKIDDPSPLITYGRKYDGSEGTWFKTN